ncbi:MAG: Cof-type HAD-IIB family hydrolase [Abditibacteriota bacterium]|nr:Cof-type HAD-IIB family hydrolase [Abditibacteriota bacterium]
MIKAAFFDLDGTLLSHRTGSVPAGTRRSLELLRAGGIKIYLSTGRHIREIRRLPAADISFDGYVTLNGHICLDDRKQKLFGLPFPRKTADALIDIFQKHRLPLVLVEESGLTLNFVNDTVVRAMKSVSTPIPGVAEYKGEPIYQACAFVPREEDDRIRALLPRDCHLARWNDNGIDVIPEGGGKTVGIRFFIEREGILPEECIAFGDAENDIEMLTFCGIGVAMGNSRDKVKEIADYVTTDIDDNGIEKALIFFGLIQG